MITDTQALADFCARLRSADYITVDTEFMRETTYWPILCLVQVAGPDEARCVDALADYMQAEVAKEKAVCQPDCVLHEFDRAAWIATCYGETAPQDNAAATGAG